MGTELCLKGVALSVEVVVEDFAESVGLKCEFSFAADAIAVEARCLETTIFPAVAVPFNEDGTINEADFRVYLRWTKSFYDKGIQGLVCNGHTGEITGLTRAERKRVVEICAEECGDKMSQELPGRLQSQHRRIQIIPHTAKGEPSGSPFYLRRGHTFSAVNTGQTGKKPEPTVLSGIAGRVLLHIE